MRLCLVSASKAQLRGHPRFYVEGPAISLDGLHPFPVPWGARRLLLAKLRSLRGDFAVQQALRPVASALSLCLSGLQHGPQTEEFAAPTLGFLTHHPVLSRPLRRAWQQALGPLLGEPAPEIRIPDPTWLDHESLAVLMELPLPALVIGDDPDWDERQHTPYWRRDSDLSQGQLYVMGAMPEVEKFTGEGALLPDPPPGERDPMDGGEEAEAMASSSPTLRLQAMRRAFAAFGFPAVMALARDVDPSALPPEDRSEWHLLVALSAYNRKVESGGDQELADFLEEHFQAALVATGDPARRSHLYYRLCINHGRRKGALAEALQDADRGIEESRKEGINPGLAGVLEAWSLNARAYVLARMGELSDARVACEQAWERLQAVQGKAHPGEVRYGLTVLADNRAELALRAGDLQAAVVLQELLAQRELLEEGQRAFSPLRSMDLARRQRRLGRAAEHARVGQEFGRSRLSPVAFDDYTMALAELQYRQGNAEASCQTYLSCRPLRLKLASPEDLATWEASYALAALRAGRLPEAEAALLRLPQGTTAAQAEVSAHLAWIAALRSDGEQADQLANQVIAAAVQAGARNLLVKVARVCGEACMALGRPEQALQAFAQALELGAEEPATQEIAAALVGVAELSRDPQAASDAAALLPPLLDDPEAWWLLPRLARLIPLQGELAEAGRERVDMEMPVTE